MEDTTAAGAAAEKETAYRYWVRAATGDAAPMPVPRKLDPAAAAAANPPHLGSVWNQDLLGSLVKIEFSNWKASIDKVSIRCRTRRQRVVSPKSSRTGRDATQVQSHQTRRTGPLPPDATPPNYSRQYQACRYTGRDAAEASRHT